MSQMGQFVVYLIMLCSVIGAIAAIKDQEKGLGKEFIEGIYSIGPIFVPVAGIMASIPYLSALVESLVGPIFSLIGADPSIAATSIIAVDMGGYQLAQTLAKTKESWITSMTIGYMAGATIVFSIPVGLSILEKKDHKYMALGMMSGLLSIPIGVLVTCFILMTNDIYVRELVSTNAKSTHLLQLQFNQLLSNMIPLLLFVIALAFGLKIAPKKMTKGFIGFGKIMDAMIKLVLVFSIVEYFTGFFSQTLGTWGFDPIIADKKDQFRALESAGYIGIMLSGAFPMVYLIQKYFTKSFQKVGQKIGMNPTGTAGMIASMANILAMFRIVKDMKPKDKVLNLSFAVCAAFLFGDHLAFTANFQPNLVLPIMIGKFCGGVSGFVLAKYLSIPAIKKIS